MRDEIVFAKEAMIYFYSLRKTSRLFIFTTGEQPDPRKYAKKGLQCGLFKAIKSRCKHNHKDFVYRGNRPTFFLKGNRPIRRRGVRNGEIQLDRKPQSLLFLPPSYFFINLKI